MTKEKIGTTFSIISIVNNLGVILASYAGAIMLDYLNVITNKEKLNPVVQFTDGSHN